LLSHFECLHSCFQQFKAELDAGTLFVQIIS